MQADTRSSSQDTKTLNDGRHLKVLLKDDSELTFDDLKFGTGCEHDLIAHMERQLSDEQM